MFVITSKAEVQPIDLPNYRDKQSNLNIISNILKLQACQKDDIYRNKKSNLENLARASGLNTKKSNNPNSNIRLLLKEVVLNSKTIAVLLPKKHRRPK